MAIAMDRLVGVGRPVPSLTLTDLAGRPVRLAEYRGRKLLLFVWGSW